MWIHDLRSSDWRTELRWYHFNPTKCRNYSHHRPTLPVFASCTPHLHHKALILIIFPIRGCKHTLDHKKSIFVELFFFFYRQCENLKYHLKLKRIKAWTFNLLNERWIFLPPFNKKHICWIVDDTDQRHRSTIINNVQQN